MWGDLLREAVDSEHFRFIPTHVGRSVADLFCGAGGSVHPHACGEIDRCGVNRARISGSSPRMWGDLPLLHLELCQFRFIPTHVGRSVSRNSTPPGRSVHPHACGEIIDEVRGLLTLAGSSPRMWGDRQVRRENLRRDRFIPTHVGRSRPFSLESGAMTVHPHACGEIMFDILRLLM
ncbi:MAG: hypothetical protein JWQ98_560 [Chlorobi bacterium]|nr:hypothetical protein [Chlorobiota bacterium]